MGNYTQYSRLNSGNMITPRCTGCRQKFKSLLDVRRAGGDFYQIGAAIKARCPCGESFGAGALWQRREQQLPMFH